jgi:hypothetical protein
MMSKFGNECVLENGTFICQYVIDPAGRRASPTRGPKRATAVL